MRPDRRRGGDHAKAPRQALTRGVPLTTWRTVTGEDTRSVTSWAPTFDADQRVTSTHWGRDRGDWLGLSTDFGGASVSAGAVDIGAWQS